MTSPDSHSEAASRAAEEAAHVHTLCKCEAQALLDSRPALSDWVAMDDVILGSGKVMGREDNL